MQTTNETSASVLSDPSQANMVPEIVDLIRSGKATRDEAIELVNQYGNIRESDGMVMATNHSLQLCNDALNSVRGAS